MIATAVIDGSTSDGYHTFDELYEHRTALFAALCRSYPELSWRSWHHHDGGDPMFDGMFIAGMALATGDITYHVDAERWDDFEGIRELPHAFAWDGHTPADVVRRLNGWHP